MAQRLTLAEKQNLFIENAINKMFEIAGHDVTYNDIKGRQDNWYAQWTMTMDQSEEWRKWGVAEINACLDIIAEFSTQRNEHNKTPFSFE